MGGRVKRGRPKGRPKARTVSRSLRVTAVKATSGRPATSVHVEVEPEELKSEVGEVGDVRGVSARIPEDDARHPGRVRWTEETLHPAGTEEREAEGKRRTVKRFFNVHYGPARCDELGVGVELDTDRGRVKSPAPGQAYTVKDDSKPGGSEIKKRK